MRVLVTGASGFVGRQVIASLSGLAEVHGVSNTSRPTTTAVRWHRANLLDPGAGAELVEVVRPTHLLHLAWNALPGVYWTTLDNLSWVRASLELIQAFNTNGGKRLVVAGTCAEYDWSHWCCKEGVTPTVPATLYGTCKDSLRQLTAAASLQSGLSYAWGRIFSLYGPHENPARLVPSVITALLTGREIAVGNPTAARDYLHVADVAAAFVTLLTSEIQGAVNIGSGEAVTIGRIASTIGEKTGRSDLLRWGTQTGSTNEPAQLVADNDHLSSLGWKPAFSLDAGLDNTIEFWRRNLVGPQPC